MAVLGKGRAARETRTLPVPTIVALRAWLELRGAEPGPLFTNLDVAHVRGRLSATSLYRRVFELGRRLGVRVRPHGLRHASITRALDLTGGDVRAVQKFSRHRDPRTLLIYDDNRKDLAGDVARLVAAGEDVPAVVASPAAKGRPI